LSNNLKGHIALLAAQIVYALNYSIAKNIMPHYMSPLALVFLRVIGASILFWILSIFTKKENVEKTDLKKMAWLALFGVVINQVFFIMGLNLTQPINSAIIMISNPIIVFVFTLIILKEQITFLKIGGLTLAISGALVLMLFKGNFQLGSETFLGDFMTLINASSWAVFVVMVKPLFLKYNTVTCMRYMFLFGSIYMLPIGLYDTLQTNWAGFTPQIIFAVTFVVVATTFIAYLLNMYGLQQLSPNVTSMYIYLQPFLATIFAIMMGKDQLTSIKIIAGILIISGLYLVNKKTIRRDEPIKKTIYD
jgi:drug/metabolite transporter (DMT)-like permease